MTRTGAFLVLAYLLAAAIAAATAAQWVPEAVMNAWPLSVGVLALLFCRSEARGRRAAYACLIAAALGLEVLVASFDLARPFVAGSRVVLLGLALWLLRWRPVHELGATTAGVRAGQLAAALVVGLLPPAGPWLAVWASRPASVAFNEEWRFGALPLGLGAFSLLGAWAILFVNTVLGEEAGWRGFLLRDMEGARFPSRFAWASALAFALWHIPADLWVARMDGVNLTVNLVTRVLMGMVYAQLFWICGRSLVPVSVAHASHNFFVYQVASPRGVFLLQPSGLEGLALAFGYLLVAGGLVLALGRLLRRSAAAGDR